MAYQVYQTEGIILAKKDFGEAERLFYIFTKEFGMIKAVAPGVRYLKSKLRPNLDLFCYNNFSLIRAKDVWKITDASEITNIKDSEKLKIFAKIAGFLIRMIKGEEKNDFIWRELATFFKGPMGKDTEIFFIAKILKNLGYLSDENLPKKQLIASINKAIKESML
jgi:DNA repair protein RecO